MNKPIAKNISYTKKNLISYATKIVTTWHKATESILEVGSILLDAKDKLSPVEFRELKRGLTDAKIMSSSTLSKIQQIAKNAVLTKPDYQDLLPPSYETLYQLSGHEDDVLEGKILEGKITKRTQQKDVRSIFADTDDKSSKEKGASKTKDVSDVISIKGDLSKITDDQMPDLKNILNKLKEFGFEVSGIELDQ